ncbi:hypothetical protein ACFL4T_05575 [candidate division KSB1 bacterium]
MSKIAIQLPHVEAENHIEIEIKVNGQKKRFNYRIEKLEWEEVKVSHAERIEKLKKMIEEYDKDWMLIQIGTPSENFIPLTFRQVH